MFTNDWGETASTWEEIERKTLAHMPEEDLVGKLAITEDSDAIIHWALHQPEFREKFKDLIKEAERDWIDWQGNIYEEEEEEEEEEKSGMVVYPVFELDHGMLAIAKDYKSAVQFLIDDGWLAGSTHAWDERKNGWDTLENILGTNWADIMMNDWTPDTFNGFWEDNFSIEEEKVFEKTS